MGETVPEFRNFDLTRRATFLLEDPQTRMFKIEVAAV